MRAWMLAGAAALFLSGAALAQKKPPAPASFEVTGVVADAKGALAGKLVRVGPVDEQGNMMRIRSLTGGGQSLNPEATTDAQGRFTLSVPRSVFSGLREDRLGIAVYTDLGGGRLASSHESAVIPVDPKQARIDAGRVVLPPLKAKR